MASQQQPDYQPNHERLEKVIQELEKPDPQGYRGAPLREYRKELGYQVGAHKTQSTIDSWKAQKVTDMNIALRMMAAGHSPERTAKAIAQGSPAIANSAQRSHAQAYARKIVHDVCQSEKCQKVIGSHRRDAMAKSKENDKRLEQHRGLSSKDAHKKEPGRSR